MQKRHYSYVKTTSIVHVSKENKTKENIDQIGLILI